MEKVLEILRQLAANRIAIAVLTVVLGLLVIKAIMRILKTAFSKMDPAMSKLLRRAIRPVLYVLLALSVAAELGFDITSVVALASVLTLAVSLSLQNVLANVFGGFTLLNTNPFEIGDYVEIAGQSGTVKDVGLSYTKLATSDNKLIFIPNAAVVAAEIVNYSAAGTRRLAFSVSVDYDADPEVVAAALLEAGAIPQVLETPAPFADIDGYSEGTALYVLRVWTKGADYWGAHHQILRRIKSVFAEKGIAMSCKHMNVNIKQ